MNMTDSLRDVIGGLEESWGIAIIGMDGILVEEQKKQGELDLQTLGAELCGLLKSADSVAGSIGAGGIIEIVTTAENYCVILRRVTDEYFMVLVIHPDGNLGKGRYLLRRAGSQVRSEL